MTKGKRLKVVRFLISPNKKKVKIEVNKIMNPAFKENRNQMRMNLN